MILFVIVMTSWILVGAIVGFYEARRGHWSWLWLLGAMAGPFIVPVARQLQREEVAARPVEVHRGAVRQTGGLRVLAGIDGSVASMAAARGAANLLGCRLGEVVLARVVDYEASFDPAGQLEPPESWDAGARRELDAAIEELATWLGFEPAGVLLSGRPANALRVHAEESGFDLVVLGTRGRGLSKRLLGSCASEMTDRPTVPVLLMPSTGSPPPTETVAATSLSKG
jgi:nucleotide-binding universal stress UspA family protein